MIKIKGVIRVAGLPVPAKAPEAVPVPALMGILKGSPEFPAGISAGIKAAGIPVGVPESSRGLGAVPVQLLMGRLPE